MLPASADQIRKRNRVSVHLPVTGLNIEMRRFCGREMLEAGIAPMLLFRSDSATAQVEADKLMAEHRRIVCACSVTPRIVEQEQVRRGELCIDDLPEEDIAACISAVVDYYTGGFYGGCRVETPDEDVLEAQASVSYQIDAICQRYHLSPLEVREWSNADLAWTLGLIEGANMERERRAASAEQDEKRDKLHHGR
jgi:hypothetical protein